jgi:hypothetical protein
MKSLIEALNHPAEAFQKGSKSVSWGLVIITILINSMFVPVLQYFCGAGTTDINVLKMMKVTGLGVLSYILISLAFWAVCKCFGSKATIADHINAWGISYAPTAVCAVVVALTEVFFYVFWNSMVWGMILNVVFVGVLMWKTILYFVYLKELARLKGWRFLGAFAVMGIIILAMAAWNGYVGLITPVL